MTEPVQEPVTPMTILARQSEALEKLTTAIELMQGEIRFFRRRVETLEGVQGPEEPPEPG